jgi:release factor glutamine methyltransferase
MTVRESLQYGYTVLKLSGIETPFLDAALLLGESLSLSKEQLFSAYPDLMSKEDFLKFDNLIEQRLGGFPVSYIRKRKEFYSLEFYVDKRVLVPRPDTEIVIDTVKEIIRDKPKVTHIHDLCSGSGAIAITLHTLFPHLEISASDISTQAREVFTYNCIRLLGRLLPFTISNLFQDLEDSYDLIVSNPPYLSVKEMANLKKLGWPEPVIALEGGGEDGTALIEQILSESVDRLDTHGYLVLEAAPHQMDKIKKLMETYGFIDINVRNDLADRERVIWGRKKRVQ